MSKSFIRSIAIASGLVLGVITGASAASAGTATANLGTSASVTANCTISTAPIGFGAYDPIVANASIPLDATGTVTVTCTNGAPTVVTLGQGSNADTGSTDAAPLRRMANGAAMMSYSLYSDAGRTTVWGNTAGTGTSQNGTGSAQNLTVYGQVAAGQNLVTTGSYADTVVATVSF
ncbi:spore coat U domain-containing protein [Alkalinema sp. FACHB-956]|uniref:Csu type fimbrial protein n=1 Tax=Alkalinema sp. FACHB-956 TaxID=2692768 RepID=UPI0016865665|nr:spore coat U domain-containing protein [Alkalinema sp. FACHB-956]MBD2326396.1 spore coat protein U domain-containing protein [Alkalinema sp. FACHB-956]